MSHATDLLETAVGNALFLGQPLNITELTVHLFSTAPDEAGTGGVEIPAGANGYQPVSFHPGADRWMKAATQDASGNTVFRNNSAVQFPTAVSAWPTMVASPQKPSRTTPLRRRLDRQQNRGHRRCPGVSGR